MRFRLWVVISALTTLTLALLNGEGVKAEVICAANLPPQGMVVVATGTAPTCTGACRAREVQPACGPIMKICANQPIPEGYVLDGITTSPACQCLGDEDNAYVIRYVETKPGQAYYGDPPFDNPLCAAQFHQPPQYGGASPYYPNASTAQPEWAPPGSDEAPGAPAALEPVPRHPAPPPEYESEPFRVGQ